MEFVYLDPATPQTGETDTPRRAQTDSAASGTRNPDLPTNAGKAGQPSTAQPPIEPAPPTTAQPPIEPDSLRPVESTRPPGREFPSQPSIANSPESSPTPATVQPAPARSTPRTLQRLTPQPPRTTATGGSPASQSINAQSGQGLDGQINPDRTSTGAASLSAEGDALWGAYVSALNRKIDQQWQRISVSEIREAKVQFEIDREGRLINARLMQSSGDSSADSVALQAIELAAPFTPFPQQIQESRLLVNFTFTYYPPNPTAD
ncbi:TonB family protein [Leptolyngbya ohadii]|uniref:TonB family protein n=1 Tax=Leptolyngbya ohadii TaxID=1962290 RepID=UPI0015C67C0F|nr:TonB family protein [Leptolyngbya ohadii]